MTFNASCGSGWLPACRHLAGTARWDSSVDADGARGTWRPLRRAIAPPDVMLLVVVDDLSSPSLVAFLSQSQAEPDDARVETLNIEHHRENQKRYQPFAILVSLVF